VSLVRRHTIKTDWLNLYLPKELSKNTIVADIHNIEDFNPKRTFLSIRSAYRLSFWLESMIFLILPVPWYDPLIVVNSANIDDHKKNVQVCYLLSDFILAAMFTRLYFAVRSIYNYSKYSDDFSRKIARHHGISANMRFAFKSGMTNAPGFTITYLFVSSTVVLAYVLKVFEMPYYAQLESHDFQNYFSSFWCVVISITTIGYGDTVPFTVFGKILIMFAAIWGTFLISLIIAIVANIFALNRNEQKAMHHLLQTRKAA